MDFTKALHSYYPDDLIEAISLANSALFEADGKKTTLLEILCNYLKNTMGTWENKRGTLIEAAKSNAADFVHFDAIPPSEYTNAVNIYYSGIDEYRFLMSIFGNDCRVVTLKDMGAMKIANAIISKIKESPASYLKVSTPKNRTSKLRLYAQKVSAIIFKQ